MTVMLLGGLWHGAQWTFVAWGALHGIMLAGERMLGKKSWYAGLPGAVRVGLTFFILLLTWVFFRAENFTVAWRFLGTMFGGISGGPTASLTSALLLTPASLFFFILCGCIVWLAPNSQRLLERLTFWKAAACLLLFAAALAVMFQQGYSPFLYFQF
jgi:alginate O-acetyltransferase complex protein AlgI